MGQENSGDKVDDLFRNGLKIIQNARLPKFGLEGVLLANYPKVKDNWKICDLCTGTGIVPLLLTTRAKDLRISGIEIVPEVAQMAKRSIILNKLEQAIEIINDDIRQCQLEPHSFDLVTVNPPYFDPAKGDVSPSSTRATARTQQSLNLEEVAATASYLLKDKGRLALVYKPPGFGEMFNVLEKYKLGVTRMRTIHHSLNSKALGFLLESQKGRKADLMIEPPLIIYDGDGNLTGELQSLYYEGKPLESRLE